MCWHITIELYSQTTDYFRLSQLFIDFTFKALHYIRLCITYRYLMYKVFYIGSIDFVGKIRAYNAHDCAVSFETNVISFVRSKSNNQMNISTFYFCPRHTFPSIGYWRNVAAFRFLVFHLCTDFEKQNPKAPKKSCDNFSETCALQVLFVLKTSTLNFQKEQGRQKETET